MKKPREDNRTNIQVPIDHFSFDTDSLKEDFTNKSINDNFYFKRFKYVMKEVFQGIVFKYWDEIATDFDTKKEEDKKMSPEIFNLLKDFKKEKESKINVSKKQRKEIFHVLNHYHPKHQDNKKINDYTRSFLERYKSYLDMFGLVLEKKYHIWYNYKEEHFIFPIIYIKDFELFLNFLKQLPFGNEEINYYVKIILSWTFEKIENSFQLLLNNNDPDIIEEFLERSDDLVIELKRLNILDNIYIPDFESYLYAMKKGNIYDYIGFKYRWFWWDIEGYQNKKNDKENMSFMNDDYDIDDEHEENQDARDYPTPEFLVDLIEDYKDIEWNSIKILKDYFDEIKESIDLIKEAEHLDDMYMTIYSELKIWLERTILDCKKSDYDTKDIILILEIFLKDLEKITK